MGFDLSQFLGQVKDGAVGTDYVKDYKHASKLFRSDSFAYSPNLKFLFHVYFTLNVPGTNTDKGMVGALVKSIQLPSFNVDTQKNDQYNRKRLVHGKIEYLPVNVTLHDDSSDTVRSMWYNYYSYYFDDASYTYEGADSNAIVNSKGEYNSRNLYSYRANKDWGLNVKSPVGVVKPAFFKDIKIYGFSRGNYVLYTLINPVITQFQHDTYDYAATGDTMEHKMTLEYEAVKYAKGRISDLDSESSVPGFGDPTRYDASRSPLSKPGSTASIFGQAGAIDSGLSIMDDLADGNFVGALLTGARTHNTFKGKDFGNILKDEIKNEALEQTRSVVGAVATGKATIFPKRPIDIISGSPIAGTLNKAVQQVGSIFTGDE